MKQKINNYEVIIIGAGPAGLLLGKELSKNFKVLILEKNKLGVTNKNWATYRNRWKKNGFPSKLIENEFSKWNVNFYGGNFQNYFEIKDNFVCFNERIFLLYLASKIKNNNSQIFDSTSFQNFEYFENGIIVNKKYTCKLLIDCSGISTKIPKKFDLIKLPIYLNCFAYIGEFKKVNNYNYYNIIKLKNNLIPIFFGFTKIAPRKAQLIYYKNSFQKVNLENYKKELDKYLDVFEIQDHKILEYKVATYPTGILKKNVLDNIFLFGDSGFLSPAFNGMGFNEILRQYKFVSKHLENCLLNNKLDENNLKLPTHIEKEINNNFFLIIALIINYLTKNDLNKLLKFVNNLENSIKQKIMRNTINDDEIVKLLISVFKLIEIKKLISKIETKILKYLLLEFSFLFEEIISEELHDLLLKHHKIKMKDIYN